MWLEILLARGSLVDKKDDFRVKVKPHTLPPILSAALSDRAFIVADDVDSPRREVAGRKRDRDPPASHVFDNVQSRPAPPVLEAVVHFQQERKVAKGSPDGVGDGIP